MAGVPYSVWNESAQAYDYYEAPGSLRAGVMAPEPRHLRGGGTLGVTVERAAWPLPSGARKVGQGKLPRGMIASRNGRALKALGAVTGMSRGALALGAAALGGYLIWRGGRRK